jgi:hypothetical protein
MTDINVERHSTRHPPQHWLRTTIDTAPKLQGAIRVSSISLESMFRSNRLGVQTSRSQYGPGSAISGPVQELFLR